MRVLCLMMVFFFSTTISSVLPAVSEKKSVSWALAELNSDELGEEDKSLHKQNKVTAKKIKSLKVPLKRDFITKGRRDFPVLTLFVSAFMLSDLFVWLYSDASDEHYLDKTSATDLLIALANEARGHYAFYVLHYLLKKYQLSDVLLREKGIELIHEYQRALETIDIFCKNYCLTDEVTSTFVVSEYKNVNDELEAFSASINKLLNDYVNNVKIDPSDYLSLYPQRYFLDTANCMPVFMRPELVTAASVYKSIDHVALYGWSLAQIFVTYFDLLALRAPESTLCMRDNLIFLDNLIGHTYPYTCHDNFCGASLSEYMASVALCMPVIYQDSEAEEKLRWIKHDFSVMSKLIQHRMSMYVLFLIECQSLSGTLEPEYEAAKRRYKEFLRHVYAYITEYCSLMQFLPHTKEDVACIQRIDNALERDIVLLQEMINAR